MKIGIVVLNYNDYVTTIECLNMLKKIKNISDVVVVDNNSTNNSWNELKNYNLEKKYCLIKAKENNGYASGNNVGINYLLEKTNVDIIGIVNPDVSFDESFIDEIARAFLCNSEYAIFTGVQYDIENRISVRAFWRNMSKWDLIEQNLYLIEKWRKNPGDKLLYIKSVLEKEGNVAEVQVVEGCCFFIRRDDIINVELLDEDTFLFYEEDILSTKIHKINRKIGVVKDAKFYHNHSKTLKSLLSNYKMQFLLLKSREIFYQKYVSEDLIDTMLFKISKIVFYIERPIIFYLKNVIELFKEFVMHK